MSTVRTQEEIRDHYEKHRYEDILGFVGDVLLPYLRFELVKPWLKPECTEEDWGTQLPLAREAIVEQMRVYMEFAWEKALNHRGISADRSVTKMAMWLWILGDDDAVRFAKDQDNYPNYGAPVLKYVCERYGFPIPDSEMLRRMADGARCEPGCEQGCGDG
jgi:hypothetical protein